MSYPREHFDLERLDLMSADIAREGEVLRRSTPALRERSAEIASAVASPSARVYLVGCGDSLDAGIAASYQWERLLRIPVEAVPAMTFATSVIDLAPAGSLVVALSQSGKVSRVVEAVRVARARGLATVTITANPDSPLAAEPVDAGWVLPFEKLGPIPGTTSLVLGALALYELAGAFAADERLRGQFHTEADGLGDLVDEVITTCTPLSELHADSMSRESPILLLGYGPSISSARMTVRKLLELTQLIALWQETEEYAHDEYSLVGPGFRLMQFAPPDRGRIRSTEVAGYLRRLGVHLSVVTSAAEAIVYRDIADLIYPLPDCPDSFVPLLYSIPGQLLSVATARRVGGSLYGMAEQVHREDGDPQIYESEIAS